jgi:hypothetical protein
MRVYERLGPYALGGASTDVDVPAGEKWLLRYATFAGVSATAGAVTLYLRPAGSATYYVIYQGSFALGSWEDENIRHDLLAGDRLRIAVGGAGSNVQIAITYLRVT